MFTFNSIRGGEVSKFLVSIEKGTRLLVVEKRDEDEEYGNYIRLTCQQMDKIKSLVMSNSGEFASATIPVNVFRYSGSVLTMLCREDKQSIEMSVSELGKLFSYYERHSGHIARFDRQFRSYR